MVPGSVLRCAALHRLDVSRAQLQSVVFFEEFAGGFCDHDAGGHGVGVGDPGDDRAVGDPEVSIPWTCSSPLTSDISSRPIFAVPVEWL
jgi:hypothetical protein